MRARKVWNKGNPLRSPDGRILSGIRVTFRLIDSELKPTDVWDAISNERILPLLIFTETDSLGEFYVNLWPNDRGEKPTYYECWVSVPGANKFLCYLTDGDTEIDWLTLRITDLMTPLASSLLQLHMQNAAVHLTPADRARLDALATMQSPFYYTADLGLTNNLVLRFSIPLAQHTVGLPLLFKAANSNTGSCSVNIDALEPIAIKGSENQDLVANQILAGRIYQLVFDGTYYQLLNPFITSLVGPALEIDIFDANSEAEMLALTAQKGDTCRRLDLDGTMYILRGLDPRNPLNWIEVTATVDSNYGSF